MTEAQKRGAELKKDIEVACICIWNPEYNLGES